MLLRQRLGESIREIILVLVVSSSQSPGVWVVFWGLLMICLRSPAWSPRGVLVGVLVVVVIPAVLVVLVVVGFMVAVGGNR